MKMLISILFISASVFANVIPYKTSLMVMGTRYRAIHTCNCLYVIKQNSEYCTNYSKIDPPVFTIAIDEANKSVSSGIMGMDMKPSVAKFSDARTGCKIVDQ
jgi:hypothetical protein